MIWIDMEMPDNCYCCILCRHADMFCRRLGKFLDRDDCYDERDRNCPLHEVTADPDTVSRKAVLDALNTITKWAVLDRNGYHVGVGMKYRDVKETVKNLPPSPSRPQIYCKDCKYRDAFKYCTYKTRLAWIANDNDYCSRAELP